MCCRSAGRCWIFVLLISWLLLSCARQVFDLIGKLWLPVIFNLLQILSCISGLFAAGQQRISLLVALTVTSVLSIVYNILLMLWYANILGDRTEPILSFGLPYSHSFFLRYTPTCRSEFNLTVSRWTQERTCVIPYYNLEGLQAMVHVILALVISGLSLIFIFEKKNNKSRILEDGYASSRSSKNCQNMPNLATAIYGESEKKNNKSIPLPPDSINDVSSGYMNSSYEAVKEESRKIDGIRKSKKKSTNLKNSRPKSSMGIENYSQHEDYSSVTTKSLTDSSVESRQMKSRPRQPFPPARTTIPKKMVNRSVSPIRRNSDEGFSEEEISKQYSKMRQKPSGHRTRSLAEQRLSQAALEQMRKESFRQPGPGPVGSSLVTRQKMKNLPEGEDSGEYLEYIKTETRDSNPNMTALISFDPKSNTLIRVTELNNDDSETSRSENNVYKEVLDSGIRLRTRRTTSQESVPSIQAPILTGSQLNLDSGHPSSSTNSASPDWSLAGIPCVTQRPTVSPPPPPIVTMETDSNSVIGYEPAICDEHPPRPTNSVFQVLQNPDLQNSGLQKCVRSTSFSSKSNFISLSTAIPLLDTLPEQPSIRFLPNPQGPPDYALPPSSDCLYSPGDYGLKLSDDSPLLAYSKQDSSKISESTQFDSKPVPSAPIILSNAGLLV